MSCQRIVLFVALAAHVSSGLTDGGIGPVILTPSTCQLMKCQNGGRCVIRNGSPFCDCPEGYHGPFCKTKKTTDPCLLQTCFNGGMCKANYGKPECHCEGGYMGDHCELMPICPKYGNKNCKGKFCSKDSHCQNGQLCCTSSCGGSRCTDPDYESNIDVCTGLCYNGGECVSVNDRLSCKCQAGFQGDRCQSKAMIDTRTCPAVTVDMSKYCIGKRCEDDDQCPYSEKCCLSECGQKMCQNTEPNPCKNYCLNGGDCSLVGSEPRCVCAAGYTGKRCDQLVPSRDGNCPNPRRLSVCFEECAVDAHCPGQQKCCKTSCGGSVCSDPVSEPDIEKPCRRTVCPMGQMCRVVYYGDTEKAEERCVPVTNLPDDTDWSCKTMNYDNVILMESDTDPDDYSPMKCDGPPPTHRCLNNSYCVDDGNNGGICCRGNMFPLEPVRPGTCPSLPPKDSLDKGILCQVDDDCPSNLKCCNAPCGGKMCQTAKTQQETCQQSCQKGFFCDFVKKTPSCPTCPAASAWECVALNCSVCTANQKCLSAGKLCNEKNPYGVCREVFSCNYKQDPCGGCQGSEVCVDTGLKCSYFPCETHACVPKDLCGGCTTEQDCKKISFNEWQCVDRVDGYNNLVAENLCEKCKQGEVCVDTGIRCVTEPCPSFKCVKAENVPCWLPCDRLHECRFVTPGCTYHPDIPCQEVPVPKCQSIMVSK